MAVETPTVLLLLPSVLKPVVGRDRLEVRGSNISEALESAFAQVPVLRHHLMLESGELRPHVLCLVNGESVLRARVRSTALAAGDELRIHQAISGG
ncbi:MAG: MoaD/ThiS family protein [Planctomycetes bacterium]|nr:MoaD/ThiS family protein [Planctomycetota bacterium]